MGWPFSPLELVGSLGGGAEGAIGEGGKSGQVSLASQVVGPEKGAVGGWDGVVKLLRFGGDSLFGRGGAKRVRVTPSGYWILPERGFSMEDRSETVWAVGMSFRLMGQLALGAGCGSSREEMRSPVAALIL